jgi:hypothetical protein
MINKYTTTSTTTYATNIQYGTSTGTSTKKTYYVLGEKVDINQNFEKSLLIQLISTINVLGKPYYDQLKKNNYDFPQELEDFLEKKFKELERDDKINQLIN